MEPIKCKQQFSKTRNNKIFNGYLVLETMLLLLDKPRKSN